ncbi:MAG: hypothetical protein K5917_02495 [Clostridiales bacterium]|nr:hypothetical protein [Clostridiales bacterium]
MNRYTGEACPICNKEFADTDDVVVCPVCGTPHHRDCWAEKGDCFNKEKHIQGYEWTASKGQKIDISFKQEFDEKLNLGYICPRCGTNNPKDSIFCTKCGLPKGENPNFNNPNGNTIYDNIPPFVHNTADTPFEFAQSFSDDEKIDDVSALDLAQFLRNNVRRYIKVFRKNKKIGWNWGAFVFGHYWFFFRKLKITGFLYLMLSLACNFIFSTLLSPMTSSLFDCYNQYLNGTIDVQTLWLNYNNIVETSSVTKWAYLYLAIVLILRIIAALFADGIYKKFAIKQIKDLKEKTATEPMYYGSMLLFKGGVSLFYALSAVFIQNIIILAVNSFIS